MYITYTYKIRNHFEIGLNGLAFNDAILQRVKRLRDEHYCVSYHHIRIVNEMSYRRVATTVQMVREGWLARKEPY